MVRKTTPINVTIEIYKLIEQNRLSFEENHDDILRRMLGLPIHSEKPEIKGEFYLGEGVSVPFGTILRKVYKGMEYLAEVKDGGIWINGKKYPTVNQAANAISDSKNQNAWKFWEVKRPQDSEWILLHDLRPKLTDAELAEFE
jgi:hypothetical protein